MANEFHIGDTVYVVEREPDGTPLSVGWYFWVDQVKDVAILRHDPRGSIWSEDDLLRQLLYDTACDDYPNIWCFPIKDCYPDLETAQRKIDYYNFTEANK